MVSALMFHVHVTRVLPCPLKLEAHHRHLHDHTPFKWDPLVNHVSVGGWEDFWSPYPRQKKKKRGAISAKVMLKPSLGDTALASFQNLKSEILGKGPFMGFRCILLPSHSPVCEIEAPVAGASPARFPGRPPSSRP